MKWYSVRSVVKDPVNKFYEERTVLVKAADGQGALDKGIKEVKEYCRNIGLEYGGYSETSEILDLPIKEYSEVFSCMRYSDLSPEEYVKRFIKTGDEVNLA